MKSAQPFVQAWQCTDPQLSWKDAQAKLDNLQLTKQFDTVLLNMCRRGLGSTILVVDKVELATLIYDSLTILFAQKSRLRQYVTELMKSRFQNVSEPALELIGRRSISQFDTLQFLDQIQADNERASMIADVIWASHQLHTILLLDSLPRLYQGIEHIESGGGILGPVPRSIHAALRHSKLTFLAHMTKAEYESFDDRDGMLKGLTQRIVRTVEIA